jgi:ATP-dependent Clp protease ATP-binding subunit ClpC
VDSVIVFRSLTKPEIVEIVDLELSKVQKRLAEHEVKLVVSDEVKNYLADTGYSPDYGARPLRRLIQNKVEDNVSETLLRNNMTPGSTVFVELAEGEIAVRAEIAPPPPPAEDPLQEIEDALPTL